MDINVDLLLVAGNIGDMNRRAETSKTGFTLIELLVVLSIIVILASLLLPAIRLVKDAAYSVRCSASLRNLGPFFFQYAEDHQGMLPPAFCETYHPEGTSGVHVDAGTHWHFWGVLLVSTFVGNGDITTKDPWGAQVPNFAFFECPSIPKKPRPPAYTTREVTMVSYGVNNAMLGPGANWGYGKGRNGFLDHTRAITTVSKPGRTIMLAEHWGLDDIGDIPVSNNKKVRSWTDPPTARTCVDAGGNEVTPNGFTPTVSGFAGKGYGLSLRHRGRSNYLFHDGHVESLTPQDTMPTGSLDDANLWTGR